MSIVAWTRRERALRGDVRLDGDGVDVVVGDALLSLDEELSITGAPIVRMGVLDPDRVLIGSGLLDLKSDDTEALGREVELVLDGVAYWLRSVAKSADTFQLTFEDRTACRLRDAHGAIKVAADTKGPRAFIADLCGRAGVPQPVTRDPGPQERAARKQAGTGTSVLRAERQRAERAEQREQAVPDSAGLTVEGVAISATQIAEANTLLSVAAQLDAPLVARVALVFAGIAESKLGGFSGTFSDNGHWGVLQGTPGNWPDPHDTAGMARAFLLGGRGFQGGGAIALSRTVSDPVQIAITVEAPSTWPTNAYAGQHGYAGFLPEAEAIVQEFGGGDETSLPGGRTITRTIESPLTVERDETFWDAAVRIAESYRFRFFVVSNTPYFLADEALMSSGRLITIGESTPGVTLLDWEWAPRKQLRTVDLECNVDAWQAPVGSVAVLDETCGPAGSDEEHPRRGRWLVGEYERSRFEDSARITLIKGRKPIVPTQTEEIELPGARPEQGSLDAQGRITTDGGAKGIVEQAAAIAIQVAGPPARVSSSVRAGDDGDHGSDDATRAARDVALPGVNPEGPGDPRIPQLERAAVAVAALFGISTTEGATIDVGGDGIVYQGYRIQMFFRTDTGGNHWNHIHVGALKL